MMEAPLTLCERLTWLTTHCLDFRLSVSNGKFSIWATMGGINHYNTVGPMDADLEDSVNECFYDMFPAWLRLQGK